VDEPRYSDGVARQERKHLQINQQLKLLVKGNLREWDDYLPMVMWRLRNSKVQHTWGTRHTNWYSGERHSSCRPRICLWWTSGKVTPQGEGIYTWRR
jgi:hypothetical protein